MYNIWYVNSLGPGDEYIHQSTNKALIQILACRFFGAKPLFAPNLLSWYIEYIRTNTIQIWIKIQKLSFKKMYLKMPFVKYRVYYIGLNVLMHVCDYKSIIVITRYKQYDNIFFFRSWFNILRIGLYIRTPGKLILCFIDVIIFHNKFIGWCEFN